MDIISPVPELGSEKQKPLRWSEYLKPFRYLFFVLLVLFATIMVLAHTPLDQSEFIYAGWIWLYLEPLFWGFGIYAQIVALRGTKRLLIAKYTSLSPPQRIPILWYFVPLGFICLAIMLNLFIFYRNDAPDRLLGTIETAIVLAPTFISGLIYFFKAIIRPFRH